MITDNDTLPTHRHSWKMCGACSAYCHNKVLYRGGNTCTYLFIGGSPGMSEDVMGEPLTGVAGKMFDDLMSQSNCIDFGITYLVACTPTTSSARNRIRDPVKEEIEACRNRIDELIEIVTPKFYISLGTLAKKHPPSGITYHLHLDDPNKIYNQSPNRHKVAFNRNKNRLKSFVRDNG